MNTPSHNLKLRDFLIGKTDAKNELIEYSESEKNKFAESYLIPENILIDDFYSGRRFYVTGLKGTGKTALLRFIGLSVEKIYNAKTSFILFKTEFTEEDRKSFLKATNAAPVLKNDESEFEDDFVNVWHWFLHRHIVKLVKEHDNIFFVDNDDWNKYEKCVMAPKLGDEKSGIMKLIPKLRRGNVELEADVEFLKGKLGLDFDWENEDNRLVKFTSIVKQANELFKKLNPSNSKIFIFIDELELALGKNRQYNRDIRLIRDLIVAVSDFNALCRRQSFPIYMITGIRSEVMSAIQSSGREINKVVADFGIGLSWHRASGDAKNHPLIKIINKKIQATERLYKLPVTEDVDKLWSMYFLPQISQHVSPQEHILRLTWYRPRDIIRLLGLAQQEFPSEKKFSYDVLNAIRKDYSTQSWIEHTEELRTKFSEEEVEAIRKLLYGIKCPFSFAQITQEADVKRVNYNIVDGLLKMHKLGDVLSLLFKVGIIGNTGAIIRFAFRGDDELILEKSMKINDPLWNYLAIEQRQI